MLTAPSLARGQNAEHTHPVPSVRMAKATAPIVVDGVLDEEIWLTAEAASAFTQQDPEEGALATQRTEVRFAMDEEALYIGARMYDTEGAAGVRSRLGRRDQDPGGDGLEFIFDTFHDHAGRTVFRINPAGVKFDAGQASPNADSSWDPVWTAGTRVDSLGWTAELRIPLSQLRFPRDSVQVWGMQIWRYVERLNERSMWSYYAKSEAGGPSRFGHLTGIVPPARIRGFEVLPYTTMRAAYVTPNQPGSPFQSARDYGMNVGGDVKALLTSTFTLDATINPDFGQVEVDPAIVNLSAFENFLPEKRPFFVEGSGLFGFGGLNCSFCSNASGMSLFYSRRIGRTPQGYLTFPTQYTQVPENTGILGAAKITGRTAGGVQVGVLGALTSAEEARVMTIEGESTTREVEPLTSYLVGRVRRTTNEGDVTVGAMGTSVLRRFSYDPLTLILPARATALGTDWQVRFAEQACSFVGNLAFSEVAGDPAAILRLQRSSARYFDRPDRRHGSNGLLSDRYDPALEALRGMGGYARLSREAGAIRWETMVNFRSPGFEVNDLAFLTSADFIWMNANLLHRWTEPTRFFRWAEVLAGGQQQFNFDGDRTGREGRVFMWVVAPNYWNFGGFFIARAENADDRLTRGGPVVHRPASHFFEVTARSDGRRAVSFGGNVGAGGDADGGSYRHLNVNMQLKPASNISISAGPGYVRELNRSQFVRRFDDPSATHFFGHRTLFADLARQNLSMDTRAAVTFTPTLTLELFAQPLIASGGYSNFKEFDGPRTVSKTIYDEVQIQRERSADGAIDRYTLDPDRNPATPNFVFDNPDFNFRSLRGNAVVRWEYRPGSTLFLVWQQSRSGSERFEDLAFSRDIGGMVDQRPDNVLMVKATYWFGR